jgi:hypothetical protein
MTYFENMSLIMITEFAQKSSPPSQNKNYKIYNIYT